MPAPGRRFAKSRLRSIGGATLVLLAAFGPAAFVHAPLLRGELPLFRDVRHFYQPMEARQQRAWSEGRVPLWNDVEGIGFPEFAEPTAATFYPGKLAFALPIPWGPRWFVYFVAHAGIACLGARRFVRACGLSSAAGLLAGTAYAASGELLFQSCNPVYLVGAAWLPWALAEALLLRRRGRWVHVVGLAAAAALAILGGDPQSVYHAGLLIGGGFACELLAAGAASLFRFARRAPARAPFASRVVIWRSRARFAAQAILAGVLAIGVASIQIMPTIEWFRQSERAASTPEERTGLELNRFDFSVGPWRWSEFLAPEVLGSPFPISRRWSYAFFPERRIWTPSYYVGLAPILLLPAGAAVARTRRRMLLPAGLAIVGLAMACGRYGPGFLIKQFAAYAGVEWDVPVEWGSPYGLAVDWLPLYESFRYPAKWMPVATLGLCAAGAAGLDALRTSRGRKALLASAGAAALLATNACVVMWLPAFRAEWFELRIRGDSAFGPWDAAGSLADLRFALLHVAVVAAAVLALAAFLSRRSIAGVSLAPLGVAGMLALAAIDPAWASRDLVPTGRHDLEPATTIPWTDLGVEVEGPTAMRYLRGAIDGLPETGWRTTSSPDRLLELAKWERDSYRPRLGPGEGGPPALRSSASLEPSNLAPLLSAWRDSRLTARDPESEATIRRLEEMSVGLLILPVGVVPARGEFVRRRRLADWDAEVDIWRLPEATPRWSFTTRPGLVRRAEQALATNSELTLSPEERSTLAVPSRFESMQPREEFQGLTLEQSAPEFARARWSGKEAAVVVWNDRFDPAWKATFQGPTDASPGSTLTLGRLAPTGRFVVIPAGRNVISFSYSPGSLTLGFTITLASIALATALLALPPLVRRRLEASR